MVIVLLGNVGLVHHLQQMRAGFGAQLPGC